MLIAHNLPPIRAVKQVSSVEGSKANDSGAAIASPEEGRIATLGLVLAAFESHSPHWHVRLSNISERVRKGRYSIDPDVLSGSIVRETLAASIR